MSTDPVARPWAIRSTLVAVADLDRSVAFYREIGPFEEIAREDAAAILGGVSPASIVLMLREMRSIHRTRHGQQSLGLRSITFNVGSLDELDRIESVLRGRDLFTARQQIAGAHQNWYEGGIRTICHLCSSAMPTTSRSDPTITKRLPIWSIHWTPDSTTRAPRETQR